MPKDQTENRIIITGRDLFRMLLNLDSLEDEVVVKICEYNDGEIINHQEAPIRSILPAFQHHPAAVYISKNDLVDKGHW